MNSFDLRSDSHLNPERLQWILSGTLSLENELVYFKHWKECPLCRQKLLREMSTAGFNLSVNCPRTVYVCSVESTISFHFACSEAGVLAASFTLPCLLKTFENNLKINVNFKPPEVQTNLSGRIDKWLRTGVPFNRTRIDTALVGSTFTLQVLFWTWLIPFGQIITYGDIALWMDKPGASRAVGQALHNNPIPVFIPCHRVIGKNGNLTGFSAGLRLKKHLLSHEGHKIE